MLYHIFVLLGRTVVLFLFGSPWHTESGEEGYPRYQEDTVEDLHASIRSETPVAVLGAVV